MVSQASVLKGFEHFLLRASEAFMASQVVLLQDQAFAKSLVVSAASENRF